MRDLTADLWTRPIQQDSDLSSSLRGGTPTQIRDFLRIELEFEYKVFNKTWAQVKAFIQSETRVRLVLDSSQSFKKIKHGL